MELVKQYYIMAHGKGLTELIADGFSSRAEALNYLHYRDDHFDDLDSSLTYFIQAVWEVE